MRQIHIGNITQSGTGNMADVLQLGPNGNWSTDGEACYFPDPKPLNCPDPLPPVVINDPCPGC